MRNDLMRILVKLKEGKLDIEKTVELIDAIYKSNNEKSLLKLNYNKKMLRVFANSSEGDRVRINLPVEVVRSILKATGKLPIQNTKLEGIDMELLMETVISALDHETLGEIATIDSRSGDKVRIVVE